MSQRDFRCVADAVEHGFAREESADAHAVDAADQLDIFPALDAVGVTLFMQARVSRDELRRDPSALKTPTGAAFHNSWESAVNRHFKSVFPEQLRQTPRN